MQFSLILLIGCRVGKRNTGQQVHFWSLLELLTRRVQAKARNTRTFCRVIPPLDAGMLVKSNAGFSRRYVCLYVANTYL